MRDSRIISKVTHTVSECCAVTAVLHSAHREQNISIMDIDFGTVCSHVMLWSGLYADSAFNDDVLHHHVVSEKKHCVISFLSVIIRQQICCVTYSKRRVFSLSLQEMLSLCLSGVLKSSAGSRRVSM